MKTEVAITPDGRALLAQTHEIWVWVLPLPQLIVAAGLLLIVLALVWRRHREQRVVDKRIAQARAEAAQAVPDEFAGAGLEQ